MIDDPCAEQVYILPDLFIFQNFELLIYAKSTETHF